MASRPHVLRYAAAIETLKPPIFSTDYEYSTRTGEPSILGLSDGETTVSVPHEEGHPYLLALMQRYPDAKWLGHSFCGAENEVWRKLGIQVRPEQIIDTIIVHYLVNGNLCKSAKKVEDDESDVRGRGFMNLYAFCSMYTDCDNWKECVAVDQCLEESRTCPEHTPFRYNGEDCYWALKAYPKVWSTARMRGVDKLYPLHRDLSLVLQRVRNRGVLSDVKYVEGLRAVFQEEKERIESLLPFNLKSPPQVKAYFREHGIPLDNAQEQTIRDAAEDLGIDDVEVGDVEFAGLPAERQHLLLALESKSLGNGPDRWFAAREFDYEKGYYNGFVDPDGFIHCRLGIYTSSGRFNCTSPNLQNVAKRRKDRRTGESIGKRVRRAIIAPEGYYLYRADYKAAEYRTFLTLAGYRNIPNDTDFHIWMSKLMDIQEDDPFAMSLGGPRDAAKSVMFGTIYLEGLKLLTPQEFRKPNIQKEISNGARLAFENWKVFGKIVTFTGINLARRALGGASHQNRAKALSYVSRIFQEFPKARDLQIKLTQDVEREHAVRTPTGFVIASYGFEEDRLKTAAAIQGSNPVAHFIKRAMIHADTHPMLNEANVLSVHDENLFYVDSRHEPKKVAEWIREVMVFALPEIPELTIPIDCSYGRNWADQTAID